MALTDSSPHCVLPLQSQLGSFLGRRFVMEAAHQRMATVVEAQHVSVGRAPLIQALRICP